MVPLDKTFVFLFFFQGHGYPDQGCGDLGLPLQNILP